MLSFSEYVFGAGLKPRHPSNDELLLMAARRLGASVDLNRKLWLKYGADVDILTIRFKEDARPTRSKSDAVKGIIYNYERRTLVSIEILDILQ